MDGQAFRTFLKRGGRSPSAIQRCVNLVRQFEQFLGRGPRRKSLDEAVPDDLESFVEEIERQPKGSAKTHLWAICYYYEFRSDKEMEGRATALRAERIKRKPFSLKDFRGVNPDHAGALAAAGIGNVQQMRKAGRTPEKRRALAERTGVPPAAILELVKLSDLARIPGLKAIRARLYHDAGVDTIETLAAWDAKEMRTMLVEFVERTGFDGIAPLPKEAASAVNRARRLPKIIEY